MKIFKVVLRRKIKKTKKTFLTEEKHYPAQKTNIVDSLNTRDDIHHIIKRL